MMPIESKLRQEILEQAEGASDEDITNYEELVAAMLNTDPNIQSSPEVQEKLDKLLKKLGLDDSTLLCTRG